MKKFIAIYILLAAILPASVFAQVQRSAAFHDKYQLKEVVVLSRHNIRSPLSTNGSALSKMTTRSGRLEFGCQRTDAEGRRS